MSKPQKTENPDQPRAQDVLAGIVESVLSFRGTAKPTLNDLSRIANRGSHLLRLDADERAEVENAATLLVAKKRGLFT